MIQATAGRYRQPVGDVEVVLHEDARNRERVGELRQVTRRIPVALHGRAEHPCVPSSRAAHRNLAKIRLVPIAFEHLAKLMMVSLAIDGDASREDVAVTKQRLAHRACVYTHGFKRLAILVADDRRHRALHCSADAILIGSSDGGEERSSIAAIPEQPRPHGTSHVVRQIRPGFLVLYIMQINPVIPGQEYDITRLIAEVFPVEVQEIFLRYKDAFAGRAITEMSSLMLMQP